jgi:enterochelin esterase family protein
MVERAMQQLHQLTKAGCCGIGTADDADFRAQIRQDADALRTSGVRVTYFESPGTAHEWQTWRRDLNNFAPSLFR